MQAKNWCMEERSNEVIKIDTKRSGGFGKLKLKQSPATTILQSCFGRNEYIKSFVFSKVNPAVSNLICPVYAFFKQLICFFKLFLEAAA